MQNVVEGIKVVSTRGDLLEEGIKHACGLGLDHLDDLQRVLVLAVVGVGCGRRCDNELDGFTNKGRVVGDIIEKFGVVGLELLHEIGYNKQLEEFGFGFEELLELFGRRFAVPSGRHGFFKYYYLPTLLDLYFFHFSSQGIHLSSYPKTTLYLLICSIFILNQNTADCDINCKSC